MEQQLKLPVEKKYKQDWGKYNLAKTNEKRLFFELLSQLSKIIPEPEAGNMGRPRIKLRDLFFCTALKLYSNYSGRKAVNDYKFSKESNYIESVPHFNTIKDFLNCPETYSLFKKILVLTAMPLRNMEDKFSLDSSGFGSYQFERWSKAKNNYNKHKNYLKGHILIGTRTNIICNCEITPGNFSDAKQTPQIIIETSQNFNIKEFSADKAYSSKLIFRIVDSVGAMAYIPFKKGTKNPDGDDLWAKMYNIFKNKQNEWYQHYHVRSNVETTFAMIKKRFGELLLSKNYIAQRNELLMKFICHNICCLIEEIYERGVYVNFKKSNSVYVERKVPKELITRDASKVQNCDY